MISPFSLIKSCFRVSVITNGIEITDTLKQLLISENGEINTIRGNADRMLARNGEIDLSGSDSAMLDNTLEYYVMNGMEFPQAVLMCIPQAWKHDNSLSQKRKDFYHYWATMMELLERKKPSQLFLK